jgi:hypothetical protein
MGLTVENFSLDGKIPVSRPISTHGCSGSKEVEQLKIYDYALKPNFSIAQATL